MKFAHFSHVWKKPGMTPAQRYRLLWRELELADRTGFDYGFCVEHHFRPEESWMSSPSLYTVAAGARTKRIRLGGMGHIVPVHDPITLVEEIALADQMLEGRLEVGLVAGINPMFFGPFKKEYDTRREVTIEFVDFLKAAYTDDDHFDFKGRFHDYQGVKIAVNPAQRPHPPLWIESRDPPTLEFCARNGIHTGYFLINPRGETIDRYRVFLDQWNAAGWPEPPNIAYSTVVFVHETDAKAMDAAMPHVGDAYRGFFPVTDSAEELKEIQNQRAELFIQRGEPGSAEIMRNLLDADYLLENDLILIGSPETVAEKLRGWAVEGMFNTFFGEYDFGDLSEADLMRSIGLFGTDVIPRLRDFEPF